MSERLEEAEGGAENQVNPIEWTVQDQLQRTTKTEHSLHFQFVMNRNRDVELAKLRKLVDEVHLESEETAHILKKKHTEVMTDFQDQIDMLSKAKSR